MTAVFAVGLAVALGLGSLADAVLLPAVDRAAPRVLGLATAAALLVAGGAWSRRLGSGPRVTLGLGLAALLGGLASAALAGLAGPRLDAFLREGGAALYYPGIVLAVAVVAAPLVLPLGALSATLRHKPALGLLGAAAGAALLPYLGEVLLGRVATLRVSGLLALTGAVLLLDRRTQESKRSRLPWPAAVALPLAAITLVLIVSRLRAETDLGALLPGVAAGLLLAGAAAGALALRRHDGPFVIVGATLMQGMPAFAHHVRGGGETLDLGHDLLVAALVVLPLGAGLGATLFGRAATPSSSGCPPWAVTTAALLAAPATLVLLLPRFPPGTIALLAALLTVGVVARGRDRRAALAGGAALLLSGTPLFLESVGVPARRTFPTADTLAAHVEDEGTRRDLLALDGHAPLGRSVLQERRFVHLPLLLRLGQAGASAPARVLVVSSGVGEEAQAALDHDVSNPVEPGHVPPFVWWLAPLRLPAELDQGPSEPNLFREVGSERQFLLAHVEPYDAILLAPDPRAACRAALLGTREWFALARARLAPGGLLCQWFDLAVTDVSDLKAVAASARSVFPATYLLLDHPRARQPCAAIVCADQRLSLSPAAIDEALRRRPAVSNEMRRVGLDGLGVACLVALTPGQLDLLAPPEDALSDTRPELGVRAALRRGSAPATALLGLAAIAGRRADPTAWLDLASVQDEHQRTVLALEAKDVLRAWQHLYGRAQAVIAADGLRVTPFDIEAPGRGPEIEAEGLVEALASLPDWPYLVEQVLAFAARLEAEGRRAEAEGYLRRAIARDESSAELRFALAALVERKGDLADARVLYGTVLAFAAEHGGAREALGRLGPGPDR